MTSTVVSMTKGSKWAQRTKSKEKKEEISCFDTIREQ